MVVISAIRLDRRRAEWRRLTRCWPLHGGWRRGLLIRKREAQFSVLGWGRIFVRRRLHRAGGWLDRLVGFKLKGVSAAGAAKRRRRAFAHIVGDLIVRLAIGALNQHR